ncbi:MAG: type II toxin-antitoxin system RelE/ParE family toxin [Bryobacterales bacterium]|nr:type II toxin-antitoxin system RelE/ParE family toxin [Bryobacterales bacterium]
MVEVRAYATEDGKSPYRKWFGGLNAPAAVKVTTALERMEDGNFSNAKPVGSGVSEYKIDFGPGYRIYFGMDGETLVILLCGGTKKRQSNDIKAAQKLWTDYRARKKAEADKGKEK